MVNRVDVVSTTPISDGVSITGLLHANLYFIDGENYIVKKVEIPFNIDYNCGCESHTYKVFISPCKLNARLITISEAEISAEILSTVYCYSQDATSGVMAIEKTAERQENSHAISVYMGLDGEELFSLSKRLNVRPEDLVEINKDLQFPLTGKERIVIYRQR